MRPEGARGRSPLAPKAMWVPNHNWAHLSQSWPQIPSNPKMAIRPSGPIFGQEPPWTIFKPRASGNHQRPPDQLSSSFLLTLRGIAPFLHAPRTQGCRSGAYIVLYTIMHNFCPAIQF
ncbi:hypothetical protein O181_128852 [Austropuccinia psidii MF-1]|uniref:Uncharacterized protein n=1 Tax=Austropuccinia psidii MF-1 TaxID=1389203 RepID=A0A9Q3KY52_9BASI|nr:hypothetical protein [Austropuccinia psidii MF-1]